MSILLSHYTLTLASYPPFFLSFTGNAENGQGALHVEDLIEDLERGLKA